ncbi:hypothetical protein Bca4012_066001 [Brassica carinata]|uniref:O-methyltransferase C-terminal domain-containing protein n=1 Tax=Brassica carinata TaxID=52824 RepID=A0A8X7VPV4_BRACI|nr:hypothetical protein Bca52824_018321 [Brassica carinata]
MEHNNTLISDLTKSSKDVEVWAKVLRVWEMKSGPNEIERHLIVSDPKWVLHDWGHKDCLKILKNCKEALPPKTGKVLIVDSVVEEKKKPMIIAERDEKLEYVKLALDMVMMAHTSTGKERTLKEWDFVIKQAGSARIEIRDIDDVHSVIIAYRS